MDMSSSRRYFLKGSAALVTAASASRVEGANDRIRIAVIGNGGRGQYLIRELRKIGGVEFVAVCDVYDVRRDQAAEATGAPVRKYGDHRELIDRTDIDAVVVATPDHWHGPIAVDALNAGKDVYVEKPMVHKPEDGKAIVMAVRKNKRILQVGTQGRGLPQFAESKAKYVDSGIIGKVGMARTWYLSNSGYVQKAPAGMEKKPEGLDWERWLGPGPRIPWNPEVYFSPYKWLNYDGGMAMGIAIHVVDSAHHVLSLHQPLSAVAGGGVHFYDDGRDTPDVFTSIIEYPQRVTVTFAAEALTCRGVRTSACVELRGTGGTLWMERYVRDLGWEFVPNNTFTQEPAAKGPGTPAVAEGVLKNWLDGIRTRKKTIANEVEGYYSTVACYMAMQAYYTKQRIYWNDAWNLPPEGA